MKCYADYPFYTDKYHGRMAEAYIQRHSITASQ